MKLEPDCWNNRLWNSRMLGVLKLVCKEQKRFVLIANEYPTGNHLHFLELKYQGMPWKTMDYMAWNEGELKWTRVHGKKMI